MTGLLTQYLGVGLLADRPATPDIAIGTLALYMAIDATPATVYAWNPDVAAWEIFTVADAPSDATMYVRIDGAWASLPTIPDVADSPAVDGVRYVMLDQIWTPLPAYPNVPNKPGVDGILYGMKDGAWTAVPAAGISDAASDGTEYVRKDAAWVHAAKPTESIIVALGDETTAITVGVAKVTLRMPYAFTLTAVRASLTTASSSGLPTVDINEAGVTILSTKLTIDASEKTSTTAATAAVISDASLADDSEITFDIDVAGTGAAGLKVYLIGHR